ASVNERRVEIGLRRAIGASRGDIVAQMLVESGLLGLAGAVLGFLIGTIVTFHHGIVTGVAGGLSPTLVALALGAGTGAGVLGGAWPAIRASRVDPATALTSA
ncbi:ABC transporter permease, partial [Kribbia dieselivorans]|uniref:ABC transporter permease n=1 Tax=Kribbia dieselivorans TaxID=331526 RepID=UPI0012EE8160